ncbi:hypothetical protein DO97_16195 [Neosynechococcus sphagnicola sy1]|uniref:Type I restriction modification DNA specificity domain-containing protein n=2 Tax=Neosynechococcus TaxID=1501143 RepID=A0A098THX3_9CYAN|nr:hypothetical protein DO97_16195 [Neosynechococcus sphagnicola sy1]
MSMLKLVEYADEMKVNYLTIRDCVQKTQQCDPVKLNRESITYIDISSIDRQTKKIVEPQYIIPSEAPSRARKRIYKDDILVSTVRPNLNSVAFVSNQFDDQIASTGFCVLRSNPKIINPIYLFYFTQTNQFVERLTKLSIGAGYPAVSDEDILDSEIPLPPIAEQKRIASIAQKCDRLRRTRRYTQQLSDSYLRSVFLEMFGDFLELNVNSKFGDVLEIPLNNGVFEKNEKYSFGTPVIWVDDLYHTISIDTSKLRRAKLDDKSVDKYEVLEGDLLFTRSSLVREGTGQINIVPSLKERTTFECHTIRARVEKRIVNPYYILGLYRSSYGRNLIMNRANTATMTTIGQEAIAELLCPIPPLPLQEKFAQIVHRFERLRIQQREGDRQAEHLFQTVLHRAFRGEL